MNRTALTIICLGGIVFLNVSLARAIDLKHSKVTQVVNDVRIISAADQKEKAAAVNDIFSLPDVLRTGNASRAELVAPDQTVTRVGANTIFSFDPADRTIDLQQGSLLFHAPHGKGGGAIHTGSATASVLGTTLIVTTTPNGGFKVIALEGEVEVKFLNGLKQKLDPGQMTYILPGANQLAPVVIFRLDDLILNSLLVRGFAQPLSSLPLIQQQIDNQLKLIHSGKLTDTGLYAGNNAGPNTVEVLDVGTITHGQQAQASLKAAEAADATLNQPSLTDATLPTPPIHVISTPFKLVGNAYFSGTYTGFIARNLFVNTPGTGQDGPSPTLPVNLSPYKGFPAFAVVAVNNFSVEGSVDFTGLPAAASLALIAGNQFLLTPGISIEANVYDCLLSSPASLALDDVTFNDIAGNIQLQSGGDISFQNNSLVDAAGLAVNAANNISVAGSQLTANSAVLSSVNGSIAFDAATLNAPAHAILIAPVAINLNDSTINSPFATLSGTADATISLNNTVINASSSITASTPGEIDVAGSTLRSAPDSGTVSLSSSFGSINVTGTAISAHYLTLNSGDGILLDAGGQTVAASGSGATASFTAPNLITVNNTDLSSYGVVNIAANTIALSDVAFAGTVNLKSSLGIWNNGAIVAGDVNDLGGVTYDGKTVNAPSGSSGLLPGTGITVGSLH